MEEVIKKVIALAKLKFDKEELEGFVKECSKIVEYFQKIKTLQKPEKKEGLYFLYQLKCPLREDKVKSFKNDFLKNSPRYQEGYFRIKKIL
jgi:aspartyl/glutamyl-tRNA(Asn/Gln) amidotransferase C subunit|uniref:Asp-tRNA(Asn)/Glu-tRNA(Gln) amidotransferase subunit GatC n=1 Tax=candidate division WOR-3 bacterium TaxID=2052148 RepID=A0A7V5XYY7_UNCW3